MNSVVRASLAIIILSSATSALAQERPYRAVGADLFASTDADDSESIKVGANLDWRWQGAESYQGIRLETARFKPLGQATTEEQRIYYRFGQKVGSWTWTGALGTNGETALGTVAVHNDARIRQEYFLERERVETPQGLEQDLYYIFAGAAFDLPINDRNVFTAVVGVQDFTGDNVRTHLRGRYIHVLKPEWGLSAQVRARYFTNSEPNEYDYLSPKWYAEVLPVLQIQRFRNGWRYQAAVGVGAQREADSDWRAARHFETSITTPIEGRAWMAKAAFVHANTPISTGYTYDYNQLTLSLTRRF